LELKLKAADLEKFLSSMTHLEPLPRAVQAEMGWEGEVHEHALNTHTHRHTHRERERERERERALSSLIL